MSEETTKLGTVLIATVGTGGEQNPVWQAIAYSFKYHQPTAVYWLCSEKTVAETLPKVHNLLQDVLHENNQHIQVLQETDHIESLYLQYLKVMDEIRSCWPDRKIVADFTSGTKAMSAALAMAAIARKVDVLSYMIGQRDASGRATVTTDAVAFEPSQIYAQGMLDRAMDYLNKNNFPIALELAEQARRGLRLEKPDLCRKAYLIKGLAMAYKKWDLFLYKDARDTLLSTSKQEEWTASFRKKLEDNLLFLDSCVNGSKDEQGKKIEAQWTDERLLDLFLNAKRHFEVGKYDDCVSRCYRLVEYMAQQRLFRYYGIETGSLEFWKLKNTEARNMFDKKTRLGLVESYRLLELEYGDKLGQAFSKEYVGAGTWQECKGELAGALQSRNQSLLAHGFQPVTERAAKNMLNIIENWLRQWIPEMDAKITKGTFVKVDYDAFANRKVGIVTAFE